jgi:hypothetical protein
VFVLPGLELGLGLELDPTLKSPKLDVRGLVTKIHVDEGEAHAPKLPPSAWRPMPSLEVSG